MQQIIREEKWNEKPGSSGGKFECFPGSDGDIPENGDAAVAGDGGAGRGGGVVAVRRGVWAEHAAGRQPGGAAQSGTFRRRLHSMTWRARRKGSFTNVDTPLS